MTESTQKKFLNTKNIIFILVGIAVAFVLITAVVNEKVEDLQSTIEIQIADQTTLLATIAETTARNGADSVTESIVKDCTLDERMRFDSLLDELNSNLSQSELVEIERLFGRCGSFFSERKAVMVSRFAREIAIYKEYIAQLEAITSRSQTEDYQVDEWVRLSETETRQSELFVELVNLQDEIITTLLSGKAADSSEIIEILEQVQDVQGTLFVTNSQAASLRTELTSL